MTKSIVVFIKGLVVGATMLVPGVSGGSMAMILGIYQKLIQSVNNILNNFKKSFLFLTIFSLGGLLGVFLLANPISYLLNKYNLIMLYFFIGCVIGGIPLMIKESKVKKIGIKEIIFIIVGIFLVLAISYLPKGSGNSSILYLLITGIILAIGLVLPGISVSYLMLVLGIYNMVLSAISSINLVIIIPLGVGVLLGILLTTKVLGLLMEKFPQITYLIILGFILGSIYEIFPGVPLGLNIIWCLVSCLLGVTTIYYLSRLN
ncbi:MAG: DUF368 domain-containing protein [Erysipelotrichaceae bacterium]